MRCRYCGEEIEKIYDPWGYDRHRQGDPPYGWYHVKATENSDGIYATLCADFENYAEPFEGNNETLTHQVQA